MVWGSWYCILILGLVWTPGHGLFLTETELISLGFGPGLLGLGLGLAPETELLGFDLWLWFCDPGLLLLVFMAWLLSFGFWAWAFDSDVLKLSFWTLVSWPFVNLCTFWWASSSGPLSLGFVFLTWASGPGLWSLRFWACASRPLLLGL